MKTWKTAVAALFLLEATSRLTAQPGVPPDPLRHPGETTVFSFKTASGKTASLCEGPKGAYLVYRFGTAAKTELQYPAVLDAGSWKKFTYSAYHRGGGVANAGMEDYRLSFENGNAEYDLYYRTEAYLTKQKEEDYRREVGVEVAAQGKHVSVIGKITSLQGNLYLDDAQRKCVKQGQILD